MKPFATPLFWLLLIPTWIGLLSSPAPLRAQPPVLKADLRHRPPEMIVDGQFLGGPLKEILEEAASRSGVLIQWRAAPFPDSLEGLKNGSVDLVPRVIRTPEREEFIHFLGPIGTQRKDILFMVPGGQEASITAYEDLRDKKIGVKKDTAYFPRFDADPAIKKIPSDGSDYALARALIEGQVNTIAVLDQGALEGAMAGLGFTGFGYALYRHTQNIDNYYGFSKRSAQAATVKTLDLTLQKMARVGRVEAIYAKHKIKPDPISTDTPALQLTTEEKEWLARQTTPLRVKAPGAWPPIDFLDDREGHQGIAHDFLKTIGERLGLAFEVNREPEQPYDILLSPPDHDNDSRTSPLTTDPFLSVPQVIITRNDAPFVGGLDGLAGQTTVVIQGSGLQKLLQKEYPTIPLLPVREVTEGLKLLSRGEAHALVNDLASSVYAIQKNGHTTLKVAAHTPMVQEARFSLPGNRPELASILNKSLASMTNREKSAIRNTWLAVRIAYGVDLRTLLQWAVPLSVVLLLLISTFIFWNRRLKREVRRRCQIESRLNLALSGGDLGFWDVDFRTDNMSVNDRWAEMLGYRSSDISPLSRQTWIETIHPDDRARVLELGRAYRAGECERYDVEYRAMAKDGSLRWLIARGAVLERENDGAPTRMVGTVQDITHRKSMEEALTESEARSRLILTSVADGIFGMDTRGRIIFVNPAALEMLGYTEEELTRCSIHETIHHTRPDGAPLPASNCRMAMAYTEGKPYRVDDEMLWRRDGSGFFVEYSAVPMRREGTVVGAVVVFRDITARMQAHKRLLTLSKAVENSPASVVITDPNGLIEYVNPRFTLVSGYTPEEVMGQNPRLLKTSLHDEAFYRELWETILSGKSWQGEFYNRRKNGEVYVELASVSPIRNMAGAITHFVAVKEDVTERKKAEESLRQAKEMAEEATRMKSDFLANMSHEIRTPMNAIIGMTHLALQTELTEKQYNYINKVQQAAKNLLGIINDILDFSKIEAGRMQLERTGFHLKKILENLADLTLFRAQDKGLTMRFDTTPEVPRFLVGDPLRLGQILLNLVNNAIKFTERGEVTVTVDRAPDGPGEGVLLRFAISDTGVGLTEGQRTRLFSAFSQADSSTSRKYGGTGLGLTISKRLVELMDGEIDVESRPGEGSIFHFTARFDLQTEPRSDAAQAADHAGEERLAQQAAQAAIRDAHLLLVEDNPVNQELALELLGAAGARVDVADNGAEAVARVGQTDYDGVLMDLQMPVMDGFEATRRIRRDPRHARLPILAMTANAMTGDRERCLACGMNDHIAKPLDVQQLYLTLARWLRPAAADTPANHEPAYNTPERKSRLPVIPGLDLRQALTRMSGNAGLLIKVLTRYLETQKDLMPRLNAALEAGDPEAATREAHTVKGLAGNIGARNVAERAAEVESLLKRRMREELPPALEGLETAHTALLARIAAGLSGLGESPAAPAATRQPESETLNRLAPLLAELDRLLAAYDSGAGDLAENLATQLDGLAFQEPLSRLKKSLARYDFEQARETVGEIAGGLDIRLAH